MIPDYGGKHMSETKKEEEKKSRKSKWLILLLLLIIFFLIGVILFMKKDSGEDQKGELPAERNVIVNNDNAEELAGKLLDEERVPAGRYEVMMNTTWNFQDGKSASDDAYVGNVERNTNAVYFDLFRSDTDEVILASPIIPVGSRMDKITLDTDLAEGSYDCVCTYHVVDDDMNPIGKVSVSVTVNVLS